eukprot:EG_transcript_26148
MCPRATLLRRPALFRPRPSLSLAFQRYRTSPALPCTATFVPHRPGPPHRLLLFFHGDPANPTLPCGHSSPHCATLGWWGNCSPLPEVGMPRQSPPSFHSVSYARRGHGSLSSLDWATLLCHFTRQIYL